jgi:hypothetical protein
MNGPSTTLRIHLQPRASRDEIVGPMGEVLKIRITAPPVNGKANRGLKRFLAKSLGISARRVEIISGQTSREKVVRISGLSRKDLAQKLGLLVART